MRAIGAKRLPFSELDDKSSGVHREEIIAAAVRRVAVVPFPIWRSTTHSCHCQRLTAHGGPTERVFAQ
jgi:hypothetical protein